VHLTTADESHGPGLTAMPAGLKLDFDFIASEMRRRQHGYGRGHLFDTPNPAVTACSWYQIQLHFLGRV